MKTFVPADFEAMEKRFRANLINGLSGAKSANLIGTRSKTGTENLALFSSVVHIGANPPLIGFVMRPVHVERHTYQNILETERFTVNAVAGPFREKAHQTSARYPKEISEFDACNLVSCYHADFPCPFVQESPIHLGCVLKEDLPIASNHTRLLVGEIVLLRIHEQLLKPDGSVDLHKAQIEAIGGLDSWHPLGKGTRFSYAKPDTPLKSIEDGTS